MWISENHPDPPGRCDPPVDEGRTLAVVPRGDWEELRVALKMYRGRPYVALRVWERDRNDAWWPHKTKGCSIRLSEIDAIVEGLQAARKATTLPPRLRPGPRSWTRPGRS